jgi:glycogen operon protein
MEIVRWNPILRRRSFFAGRPANTGGAKDLTWIRLDGHEIEQDDWQNPDLRVLGMLIDGHATDEVDERGIPIEGDSLLLVLNGGSRSIRFALPPMDRPGAWTEILNTARPGSPRVSRAPSVRLMSNSLILLRHGEEPNERVGS